MGISTFRCPECGAEVKMGIPRNATIKAITVEDRTEPDEGRAKVRENLCENGHEFNVFFRF